jgi:hypothetical protein
MQHQHKSKCHNVSVWDEERLRGGCVPKSVEHLCRQALERGLRELLLGEGGAVDDVGK